MKSLPTDLLAELEKDVMEIRHLVTLTLASRTFRWVDGGEDIYYSGNWYQAHPIKFTPINLGTDLAAQSIRMETSNLDKTFSNLVLAEDTRNKECVIQRVLLDRNGAVIGVPIPEFFGYTDDIQVHRAKAKIEVVDEFIRWKTKVPRRIHEDKCTWRIFKGPECRYAGAETWCDRTWARCNELTVTAPIEAALQDDGGVFTNETTAANNATINDMNPPPFGGSPVVNDAYYFGLTNKWPILMVQISTAGAGTWAITWEYWNGSSWAAIPNFVDMTVGFKKIGIFNLYLPVSEMTGWVESTVNAITSYWIRARLSSYTSFTINPKGAQAWALDGQYIHFGGFRFLRELQDKELWWGTRQKTFMNTER